MAILLIQLWLWAQLLTRHSLWILGKVLASTRNPTVCVYAYRFIYFFSFLFIVFTSNAVQTKALVVNFPLLKLIK